MVSNQKEVPIKYTTWKDLKEFMESKQAPDHTMIAVRGLEESHPWEATYEFHEKVFCRNENGVLQSEVSMKPGGTKLPTLPVLIFD
jgi:hypothetical protein